MTKRINRILLAALLGSSVLSVGCRSGKIVPPVTPQVIVSPDTGIASTNYVVAPEWSEPLETVQAVGNLLPPPYGTWLALAGSGVLAILGARARTKQKNAEGVAETIIDGIDKMANPDAKAIAKESVQTEAAKNGTLAQVHKAVRKR